MRLRSVLSEAAREVASSPGRVVGLGLLFAVLTLCVWGLDVRSVRQLVGEADAFRDSGSSVFVLSAPGGIDGAACEHLAGLQDIVSAGALRQPGRAGPGLTQLPAAAATSREVTPGFPAVIGARAGTSGALLARPLASELGAVVGSELSTSAGRVLVGDVYNYPEDGRDPTLQFAILIPVPATGVFDECWADVWPTDSVSRRLLGSALTAVGPQDSEPALTQLNPVHGQQFDGLTRLRQRPTGDARWLLTLGAAVLAFATVRARRLELASARHAGVRAIAQQLQLGCETSAWLLVGSVLVLPVVAYVARSSPSAQPTASQLAAATIAAGWVGALAGMTLGVWRAHEAALFKFFKDR